MANEVLLFTWISVSLKPKQLTRNLESGFAASGGFLPAGLSASVNPGYGNSNQAQLNPFYGSFYNTSAAAQNNYIFFRANNYALNFYNGLNSVGTPAPNGTKDPYRIVLVYAPITGTTVGGNYDGDLASQPNPFTSGIGNGLAQGPSQDQLIVSDFESLFLQAEATARGFNVGSGSTADQLLQMAIEQNFVYLGETAADADAYYTAGTTTPNPNVSYTAAVASPASGNVDATPGLQAIMTQKWIALNGINWFQAYTDFRRTQFPLPSVLGISHANSHVKNAIPYRFPYTQSEINTNGANVPSLAAGQYTPIFWDTFDH